MIQPHFILRQLSRSSRQAIVFILCVGMSITSLTAFSGFSTSINRSLLKDAKKLHAADIIIRSNNRLSEKLEAKIYDMIHKGQVSLARYYEFYSVVRSSDERTSLLTRLKVVEEGYPFYGNVVLESGRSFKDVLTAGSAVVGKSLLDRMGVSVGDNLLIGYTTVTIRDVVMSEPDRAIDVFSFGPRVFISSRDLDALGLLKTGSRASYVSLLKVHDDGQLDSISDRLKQAALDNEQGRERVDTFQTANSRVKRFFDNFFFFLKLVGIFIMIISGVGIQGSLTALLREKQSTIAIMKSIGATNRYITLHFMLLVFILGLLGTVMGILSGALIQHGLGKLLSSFLPPNTQLSIVWTIVAESIILGFAVVAVFTFIPLYRLRGIRPIMIFREEMPHSIRRWPIYFAGILFTLFFFGLVLRHMKDFHFGLYFVSGVGGLILIAYLLTLLLLFMLKKIRPGRLAVRQAIKGLFRQGSATGPIIITLTSSLCVIFSIYLIEQNLNAFFIQSYPEDAPNLFALDIQTSQAESFMEMMGQKAILYPVVRARITAINGETINRKEERRRRGDNLGRTFNLTYRENLLEDEKIIKGTGLFRKDRSGPQVSVLDTVIEMREMDIGDIISFNIQGVELDARVSSIRTRTKESISPFFYFVFQEATLKDAPQTIFSALRVERSEIASIQTNIVKNFPNISVIDVADSIEFFAGLMKQLSAIIRGFSLLSILAGILIMISAVFATRSERIIESVYYKILGAKKAFILKVFALENVIVGLLSGCLALVISHAGAFLICKRAFNISYQFFISSSVFMLGATLILIIFTGFASSRSILMKKPISYLRKRADE